MLRITRLFGVAAVMLLNGGLAEAQQREWIKWHERIVMDEVVYGEYTYISTSDDAAPDITRFLYRDSEGALLVIRSTISLSSTDVLLSAELSVADAASGEQLSSTLNADGTWTVAVGAGSLIYTSVTPLPASVLVQAGTMLESNSSAGFRSKLERLARVGAYYAASLADVGETLRTLFFQESLPPRRVRDYAQPSTDTVKSFDPNVTGPTVFDQQFGQSYYQ